MRPRRSRSRQPRLADHTPTPVTSSTRPGTATPTASRSTDSPTRAVSSTTALAATSPSWSPTFSGVGRGPVAGEEGCCGVGDLAPPGVDDERVATARELDDLGGAGVLQLALVG